jgi:hypothetical protein
VASAGQAFVIPAGVPNSVGNPGPAQIDGIVERRPARQAKGFPRSRRRPGSRRQDHTRGRRKTRPARRHLLALPPRKPGHLNTHLGAEPDPPRCGRWPRPSAHAFTTTAGTAGSGQLAEATQNHPQPPAAAPRTRIARHERPLAVYRPPDPEPAAVGGAPHLAQLTLSSPASHYPRPGAPGADPVRGAGVRHLMFPGRPEVLPSCAPGTSGWPGTVAA